jgi:hypothetical protein
MRRVGGGRVGVCILCVCDREECDRGVGTGVNDPMLQNTTDRMDAEAAARVFRLRKRPMNLCVCDIEERAL